MPDKLYITFGYYVQKEMLQETKAIAVSFLYKYRRKWMKYFKISK